VGRLEIRGVEVKTRRLWFVFLYAIGTLGIYYIVWYYRVHSELQRFGSTMSNDESAELYEINALNSALAVSIGSWLIVPPFVSQWRFYRRIRLAQELGGIQEHERINHTLGFVLFLLAFFLLPFEVPYAQSHLNRLWKHIRDEEQKARQGMRRTAENQVATETAAPSSSSSASRISA